MVVVEVGIVMGGFRVWFFFVIGCSYFGVGE